MRQAVGGRTRIEAVKPSPKAKAVNYNSARHEAGRDAKFAITGQGGRLTSNTGGSASNKRGRRNCHFQDRRRRCRFRASMARGVQRQSRGRSHALAPQGEHDRRPRSPPSGHRAHAATQPTTTSPARAPAPWRQADFKQGTRMDDDDRRRGLPLSIPGRTYHPNLGMWC